MPACWKTLRFASAELRPLDSFSASSGSRKQTATCARFLGIHTPPIYPIPPGLFLFNFAAAQYPYPSCLAAGLRVEYWREDGGKSWGFLAREKKL